MSKMNSNLIRKYNIPCPRYTSYPTVPYWEEDKFSYEKWLATLRKSFIESNSTEGISLYIHLPFCESLCTFCGCNKRITKQHSVETPYIDAVLKEWNLYCEQFPNKPIIKEIHLGGGTPTFFSTENLKRLLNGIFEKSEIAANHEFSFEGHPNNTTREHLQTLYDLGFRRVSFGVQDYSPTVQKAIHRIQPFENVKQATDWSREIGYASVSHDLIFGLPFQTLKDIFDTIEKTISLQPDRLAFYSYAHVPWIKGNGQRGFKDEDVPKDEQKREMYEKGKQLLLEKGYIEIGMDHFALESDSLYTSYKNNVMHRNFMGYTSSKTQLMIGLGVSSIGDTWYSFAQNEKTIEEYYKTLEQNKLPITRGHLLNEEDLILRKHILDLMCHFQTSWDKPEKYFPEIKETLESLKEMENDGLVILNPNSIQVTEAGRPFIRNICMAFDLRLKRKSPEARLFSMAI
ncbi:MAG: oxygen-independent coproporphyrinogen III oxidase [Flavobacteriaceae bacterium]